MGAALVLVKRTTLERQRQKRLSHDEKVQQNYYELQIILGQAEAYAGLFRKLCF